MAVFFQWAFRDVLMRDEKWCSGELKFKIQKIALLYVVCTHIHTFYIKEKQKITFFNLSKNTDLE